MPAKKKQVEEFKEWRDLYTPKAVTIWTDVKEPKKYFNRKTKKETGDPTYSLGVYFPDKKDEEAFEKELIALNDEYYNYYEENGLSEAGYQRELKANIKVNDDGKKYFIFRSNHNFQPKVEDSQGNPVYDIPEQFRGSNVQVLVRVGPSHFLGDGANFYLTAIQILDLNNTQSSFKATEGSFIASVAPSREPSNPEDYTAPDDDLDDEIPFG